MDAQGKSLTRAQAEQRMLNKLAHVDFLADIRPLPAADAAAALTEERLTHYGLV